MARTIATDYADKRRAILRAAARLFADEGFNKASMANVATACGISKANIYHYYPSKTALLFDMLESHLRMVRDRLCALEYTTDDPKEQLRMFFVEVLIVYQGADAEHDVLINATQALKPEQQEQLKQYQRDFVRVGRERLAAICPPEIAQDKAKLWALTMSIFGMLNWHYKWSKSEDPETRRGHAILMADLVISGLPNMPT